MPDCSRIDPLVTPYVDGELPESDVQVVRAHLERCAPCHARVAAERAVHSLVRARQPELAAPAPPRLRARCAQLAAAAGAPARPGRLPAWLPRAAPLAIAATLVLIVASAFVYRATQVSARVMVAELAADHMKCFMMNAALGTHAGPDDVERAMVSKFGWPADLPDNPQDAGLELVGERTCLYGEGRVAHIMYKHEGKPVSLFMLPDAVRAQEMVRVLGHEAAVWSVGNRSFVLVSREPRPIVEGMASFVHAGLR